MTKTATISIRIEPETKAEAEDIFAKMGLSLSDAVNVFLKQTILRKKIPFDIEAELENLDWPDEIDMSDWSEERLIAELKKGVDSEKDGAYTTDEVWTEAKRRAARFKHNS